MSRVNTDNTNIISISVSMVEKITFEKPWIGQCSFTLNKCLLHTNKFRKNLEIKLTKLIEKKK